MIDEEESSCWVTDPLGSYLVKPMIFSALMTLFYAQRRILMQQCSRLIGRSIFIFQIILDRIYLHLKRVSLIFGTRSHLFARSTVWSCA